MRHGKWLQPERKPRICWTGTSKPIIITLLLLLLFLIITITPTSGLGLLFLYVITFGMLAVVVIYAFKAPKKS